MGMARQPEHLLQSGSRQETECTNLSVAGLLHQKGKVTISRSLLIILTAVAIILSASVVAISTLMDFTELAKGGNLLSTALISFLGLMFHKTRK